MKKRRLFHLGLWGPQVNQGVDWEIEHHLAEQVDELMARGYSRADAEREAMSAFGDVQDVRRTLRGIDRGAERRARLALWLETMLQDVRYGLRGVRREPAFSLGFVLTLGLGLGAFLAMFTVIDALLFRPLPYRAPHELVQVEVLNPKYSFGERYIGLREATAFRSDAPLQSSFLHSRLSTLYTGGVEPRTLTTQAVTHEFEETLGVQPALGRGLLPEDAVPGATPVVLIAHDFWRSELASDPAVLTRTIRLNHTPHRVIGVMPRSFKFPHYSRTDAWLPIATDGTALGRPTPFVEMLGRVAGGDIEAASARTRVLSSAIYQAAQPPSAHTMQLVGYNGTRVRGVWVRQSLWLLAGAVTLILLVACVNVVNLLLVRATTRTREIAIRLALGAARLRVLRQLVLETLTLAVLSGLAALTIALLALRVINVILPEAIRFYAPHAITIDGRALLFAFVVTVASGLLLGLGPAWSMARRARVGSEVASRYSARTHSRQRVRNLLVATQVALSVILLVGATLLLSSFLRLQRVDPGLRLDNLAVLTLSVSSRSYPTPEQRGLFLDQLETRIEALPGVQSVTVTEGLPPSTSFMTEVAFEVEGESPRVQPPQLILPFSNVRPDFFQVTGARILAGRSFAARDRVENGNTIIDEDLARYLWPATSAVGRRFRVRAEQPWLTVVGVMADLKLLGPDDRSGDFELLFPMSAGPAGQVTFAVRTAGEPALLFASIRSAVYAVNPDQTINDLASAQSSYAAAVDMPRFLMMLVTSLAVLAFTLAAIGIYGVLAFVVNQKRHELCVRMALGAQVQALRNSVLRQGLLLALAGTVAGLAGALALGRFIRGTLYGVQPTDPFVLASVGLLMLATAILACWQPARRATTVNPAAVLRSE